MTTKHCTMKTISGCRVNFDPRTTAEAERTRDMANRKPYRTQEEKYIARDLAKRHTTGKYKGTWFSPAPRSYHSHT